MAFHVPFSTAFETRDELSVLPRRWLQTRRAHTGHQGGHCRILKEANWQAMAAKLLRLQHLPQRAAVQGTFEMKKQRTPKDSHRGKLHRRAHEPLAVPVFLSSSVAHFSHLPAAQVATRAHPETFQQLEPDNSCEL